MKAKILMSILAISLSSTGFSANCPNLTGFYWEVEGDKPQGGALGRMTEIRQQGCENLVIYVHWVDSAGKIVHEDKSGYVWKLNGSTCDPYQTGPGIDCRAHPFDQTAIYTIGNAVFPTAQHGFCKTTQFSWAPDSKGILESIPCQCADGFSGTISRIITRAQ